MAILMPGLYTTDDGMLRCALDLDPDTIAQMGFAAPALDTPRRPHRLLTRKEVFINAAGRVLRLPYPNSSPPYALGATATLRGDPTYIAIATLGEVNRAESL